MNPLKMDNSNGTVARKSPSSAWQAKSGFCRDSLSGRLRFEAGIGATGGSFLEAGLQLGQAVFTGLILGFERQLPV